VKAKKDLVPETVEKKAEEAKEPAQTAFNEETGEINWDCPVSFVTTSSPDGLARALSDPARSRSIMRDPAHHSALAEWPTDHAESNSKPPSHALSTLTKSPRASSASRSSSTCRIASGSTRMSTARVRTVDNPWIRIADNSRDRR